MNREIEPRDLAIRDDMGRPIAFAHAAATAADFARMMGRSSSPILRLYEVARTSKRPEPPGGDGSTKPRIKP